VLPGGVLDFATAGSKTLHGLTLLNQGSVWWNGGALLTGSTPTTLLTNQGLWEITTDATCSQSVGGPPPLLVNEGTLRKTAGTGTTRLSNLTLLNLGTTEVLSGTLQLPDAFTNRIGKLRLENGRLEAPSVITLQSGRLEGIGDVGNFVGSGGTITPGSDGTGLLRFLSGFTLTTNVTLHFAVTNLPSGPSAGRMAVNGSTSLGSARFELTTAPGVPIGSTLTLVDNDGSDSVSGAFQDLADGSLFAAGGQLFRLWYTRGTGNDVVLVRDDGGVRLQTGRINTNGFYAFNGRGTNFATYTILAATNLLDAPWVILGTANADAGGLFEFVDTDRILYPTRFYRTDGP
jgi:hypothetical protein